MACHYAMVRISFTIAGIVLSLTSASSVTASAIIPPDFDQICHVRGSVSTDVPTAIVCEISENDTQSWRMDTLRKWAMASASLPVSGYTYDTVCGPAAKGVSIPWPMSSPGLISMRVTGCHVTDLFADFLNPVIKQIPDQLTAFEMLHSVYVLKQSNLMNMFSKVQSITSDYECLHTTTLEKLVYRNVSYKIDNDISIQDLISKCMAEHMPTPDVTQKNDTSTSPPRTVSTPGNSTPPGQLPVKPTPPFNIAALLSNSTDNPCTIRKIFQEIINLPKKIKNVKVECNYSKLKYLDDSTSSVMSVYHHRFLTKFSKFPVLEFLNYSNNYINVLPEELRDWTFYFNVMHHMDLSHNLISTINFKSPFVNQLENDTYINLQYNNITTLTRRDLDMLGRQRKTIIDIRHNPIHCDCSLLELISALSNPETFSGKMKKYEYIKDMQCHLPENLAGRTLMSVHPDEMDCDRANDWIVPFAALAVVAVVFGTILVLGFVYRKEIRILFYTRLHIQMPGDVYVGLGQKRFHAFVSYSNEDEDWVEDVLCRKLEEPADVTADQLQSRLRRKTKLKEFKLCLHGRNFMPGMTIIENIINSVQGSRHTIIVLSLHFVNSKWSMEEFIQAYNQSILERRRHLIIVILEDVPEHKLNPLLKRCMKTFTYLKVSDKLFYDRLAYSLSFEHKMTKGELEKEHKGLKGVDSVTKTTKEDRGYSRNVSVCTTKSSSFSTQSGSFSTQCSSISECDTDCTHL